MTQKVGEQFRGELGCDIPEMHLAAFSQLDSNLVKIIEQKAKTSTDWEELSLFFKLKQINPQLAHKIAKELKSNPAVPNRGQSLSSTVKKKKWNVLKVAGKHLDETDLKALELYLGIGIKKSVKAKVTSLLTPDDEELQKPIENIDEDFELWDVLYPYLKTDAQIGEVLFDADGELDLQDLQSSVPQLVKEATKEDSVDPKQLSLPL